MKIIIKSAILLILFTAATTLVFDSCTWVFDAYDGTTNNGSTNNETSEEVKDPRYEFTIDGTSYTLRYESSDGTATLTDNIDTFYASRSTSSGRDYFLESFDFSAPYPPFCISRMATHWYIRDDYLYSDYTAARAKNPNKRVKIEWKVD